jgi:hypothetical protein
MSGDSAKYESLKERRVQLLERESALKIVNTKEFSEFWEVVEGEIAKAISRTLAGTDPSGNQLSEFSHAWANGKLTALNDFIGKPEEMVASTQRRLQENKTEIQRIEVARQNEADDMDK